MSLETEFHTELELRVIEWCQLQHYTPAVNYRLPHGKIADIIYMHGSSDIGIIEVKTFLSDSLVQAAITKYQPYCNYLYIAAPADQIAKITRNPLTLYWPRTQAPIGMLAVGNRAVSVIEGAGYKRITSSSTDQLMSRIKEYLRIKETRPTPSFINRQT